MYVLGNLTLLSGSDASLCAAVITVAVNVLSTVEYIHSVDKVGRRMLLLETGIQMFLSRAVIRVIYTRIEASGPLRKLLPKAMQS